MRQLLRRGWYLIWRRRFEADLREELEFHRASIEREMMDGGAKSPTVQLAARRAMGSIALAQDQARDVWTPRWLQGLGHDVRVATRGLRGGPIVTTVAVLSLALGIGANTAIFSIINSLALRGLPVRDPAQLVFVTSDPPTVRAWSYPLWQEIHRHTPFEQVAAFSLRRANFGDGGETRPIDRLWASGSFFDAVGVHAMLGRTFTETDDQENGGPNGPVAVISARFWQREFGGTPDVLGRSLTIDGQVFTIIGVTPSSFFGLEIGRAFDAVVPLEQNHGQRGATVSWLTIIGRLKPGQSADAATAALRGIQTQIRDATLPTDAPLSYRTSYLQLPFSVTPAAAASSTLERQYQHPLLIILVVAILVAVIASANIVHVLLARAAARRHEFSLRVALGASRWRLARPMLVESGLVVIGGVVLGLVLASWASGALVSALAAQAAAPQAPSTFLETPLDPRVLAFTMAVTTIIVLCVGVAPAYVASTAPPVEALKTAAGGASRRGRWANGLIVGQIATSVVLVVAALLFVRTFVSLMERPLGLSSDHMLIVTVTAPRTITGPEQRAAVFDRALQAVRALPGQAATAASLITPVSGLELTNQVEVVGAPVLAKADHGVVINEVSPGWFQTFDIPLQAGRDFLDTDRQGGAPVAIVNEAFARNFLRGENPVGHSITGVTSPVAIVGMVGDAIVDSIRGPIPATVYLPYAQSREAGVFNLLSLSIRTTSSSMAATVRSVGDALRAVDPGLTWTAHPLAEQIDASLTQERLLAELTAALGGLALLLAGIGIYGVLAYAVSRRQREIGIRMALGAAPFAVLRLVLARTGRLIGAGILLGVIVSALASRFVASLLYGVTPGDPVALAGSALVLSAMAAIAAALPAWRAVRIDPAVVLRNE